MAKKSAVSHLVATGAAFSSYRARPKHSYGTHGADHTFVTRPGEGYLGPVTVHTCECGTEFTTPRNR